MHNKIKITESHLNQQHPQVLQHKVRELEQALDLN